MKQIDKIIFISLDNMQKNLVELAGKLTLNKISSKQAIDLCNNFSASLVYLNNIVVEQIEYKMDEYIDSYNDFSNKYIELDNSICTIVGIAQQNLTQDDFQPNL